MAPSRLFLIFVSGVDDPAVERVGLQSADFQRPSHRQAGIVGVGLGLGMCTPVSAWQAYGLKYSPRYG